MDKIFHAIESFLVSEAWGGRRLDEASNLVKEYCYRAGVAELGIRGTRSEIKHIIATAMAPAVQRIFLLTRDEILAFTEDLVFVDAIPICFHAVALLYNHVTKCLVVAVRSHASKTSVVIIHPDRHVSHPPCEGLMGFSEFSPQLFVDSDGDNYLLCNDATWSGKYQLTRFDATFSDSRSIGGGGNRHICPHDGRGVVLVNGAFPVQYLDRDLGQFRSYHHVDKMPPRYISLKRNLMFAGADDDTLLHVVNIAKGAEPKALLLAFSPFPFDLIGTMSNGTFCFLTLYRSLIRLTEPCFISPPRSFIVVRS